MVLFCLNVVSNAQLPYTFTNTARNIQYGIACDVAVASDGTVFLANGTGGLRAYSYDGTSFSIIAHIDDGFNAIGVAVGSDSTVFLASHRDGLRAYSYDGTSFSNTAHINEGGDAVSVAVDSGGTIFLANEYEGMYAYAYSGYVGIKDNFSSVPGSYALSQNYPNPFNSSTIIFYSLKKSALVSLKIYDLQGSEIKTLVNEYQNVDTYSINFDASDLVSGAYYYQLKIDNEFTETKKMVLLR